MSYAEAAAHNAPPSSEQPKPDPALLNTDVPSAPRVTDETTKVEVVAPDYKQNPATTTSQTVPLTEAGEYSSDEDEDAGNVNGSEKRKRRKERRKVEQSAVSLWNTTKEQLLRPGVAGGLVGLVNVGILGYASYALYTNPPLRRDARVLSISSVSLLGLFSLEGFLAERYAQTPRGREERKRARKEGAALYRHAREVVLRPGVLGGLVGLLNVGVLGGVGYAAYVNWDAQRWDRRAVSAVAVGLLGLWGTEGVLAEKYRTSGKA